MQLIAFNASPRKDGNTATMLRAILEGAQTSGSETELVHLIDLNMKGCQGCGNCYENPGRCALKDGFAPYMEKILKSDVIVIGTPIYIFQETALCKSFIERFFCFTKVAVNFETGETSYSNCFPKGKRFCFVLSQTFPDKNEYIGIINYLKIVGSFLTGHECEFLQQVAAIGKDAAKQDLKLLAQARDFGRKIGSYSSVD